MRHSGPAQPSVFTVRVGPGRKRRHRPPPQLPCPQPAPELPGQHLFLGRPHGRFFPRPGGKIHRESYRAHGRRFRDRLFLPPDPTASVTAVPPPRQKKDAKVWSRKSPSGRPIALVPFLPHGEMIPIESEFSVNMLFMWNLVLFLGINIRSVL